MQGTKDLPEPVRVKLRVLRSSAELIRMLVECRSHIECVLERITIDTPITADIREQLTWHEFNSRLTRSRRHLRILEVLHLSGGDAWIDTLYGSDSEGCPKSVANYRMLLDYFAAIYMYEQWHDSFATSNATLRDLEPSHNAVIRSIQRNHASFTKTTMLIIDLLHMESDKRHLADNSKSIHALHRPIRFNDLLTAAGNISDQTLRRVRDAAGIHVTEVGGAAALRTYTREEIRRLIDEATTGPYRNKTQMIRGWASLI